MKMNIVSPESVGFSSERLGRIATAMQGCVDAGRPPGIITLVARRGKVVHFECFGLRDVEAGKPMRPDTILRIYSMTKPITSVALMMLFEEGRFLLREPVAKYIPEFKDLKVYAGATETGFDVVELEREITILDLLTHTSGLAYGVWPLSPVEELYQAAGIHDARGLRVSFPEMIRLLAELPLAHQPGTAFLYSLSFDVIAHLVSVLADQPFDVYLQERIFAPLGMVDTGYCVPSEKLERFSALYDGLDPGELVLMDPSTASSPYSDPNFHPAGGHGLVSTAADYVRFAQMLLNGGTLEGVRLLGRKTIARMTANHLSASLLPIGVGGFPWPGMGYGLGFGVVTDASQRPMLASAGEYGWPGIAGTQFWVDPEEELIGLSMPQVRNLDVPTWEIFQNLVYQALVD